MYFSKQQGNVDRESWLLQHFLPLSPNMVFAPGYVVPDMSDDVWFELVHRSLLIVELFDERNRRNRAFPLTEQVPQLIVDIVDQRIKENSVS
jgi:hypothetical protein